MAVSSPGLEERLADRAARRKIEDLTVGPVLSWTTERMLGHIDALLKIPGALPFPKGRPKSAVSTTLGRLGASTHTATRASAGVLPTGSHCVHVRLWSGGAAPLGQQDSQLLLLQ